MTFKPNYIPKERKKVNYKIVVPFIVLMIIVANFLVDRYLATKKEEGNKSYAICQLSSYESIKLIDSNDYTSTMNLSDYGLYGESLGLYHEPFTVHSNDTFSGKTVFLKNLCKDTEDAYMMDVDLDRKLPIFELDNGFYEIEVLDGLDRYYLTSENVIQDVFYSVPYNGHHKKVKILADKDMFYDKDGEKVLKDNIVYFEVSEEKVNEKTVDIVLDPNRLTELWEGYVDYGSTRGDVNEANEMFEMAQMIKKELEQHGLEVLLTRDLKEPVDYNNYGGRLEKAYQSKAKYFVSLAFPDSNFAHDKGVTVMYSSHSSNYMATTVMKTLQEQTSIQASSWTGRNDIQGVYPSTLEENLDRRLEIRETGGRFTGAGIISENPFVTNYQNGMQAIVIEYGYMSNDHDFNTWQNEKEKIAKATADGILKTLKIIK